MATKKSQVSAESPVESSYAPPEDAHPADKVDLGGEDLQDRDLEAEATAAVNKAQARISTAAGKEEQPYGLPEDGRLASDMTEEEIGRMSIVRDPWQGKNAMKFIKHPAGVRLYWCNPNLRERIGPRGFTPVKWDDPIGREIHQYLSDPPSKFDASSKKDNIIRRGDSVLCWIPEGMWEHRQLQRTLKANQKLSRSAARGQRQYGPSGRTFGEGLQDDESPEEREAGVGVGRQDHTAYRRAAAGDIQQGYNVGGRRMFDK